MDKKKGRKKMSPEIVLASSSPVREGILNRLRVVYATHPSQFEEEMTLAKGESFEDLAKRLALGKARDVAAKVANALVIGLDSFALLNREILGKPQTNERAVAYLRRLSGKTHEFFTGIAVVDTIKQREIVDCTRAIVHFRDITEGEAQQYVEREDVTTAAAAYRIQGLGAMFVERIEGDYFAIVGLSPSKLTEMLRMLDVNLFDYIPPLR